VIKSNSAGNDYTPERVMQIVAEAKNAIRVVAQVAHVIAPRTVLSVVTADPDDNRILECAVDGKADIIVPRGQGLNPKAGLPPEPCALASD
jgi:predicted nucleic acid-binding protein